MDRNENEKTLADYLGALKRYRGRMGMVIVAMIVASIGVAFGLPPVYRSSATILIEQQEIPTDLVRSTITSFADQRIQVISQRVMTRANLMDIIKKYNLYPDDQKTEPTEVLVENMHKDIKMNTISADVVDPRSGRPTQATIAFTVSYDSESPGLAQKVANELVSLYLNENLKSRTEATEQTSDFLSDEARKLSELITDSEKKLAEFKTANADELPELSGLNMQVLDRAERDMLDVDRDMRSLRERKAYLEAQIAQVSETTSLYAKTGERLLGPEDRLKQLQTSYVSLLSNYGADHPDVVRARKEIDALKKEVGGVDTADSLRDRRKILEDDLEAARKKYGAEHPDVKRLQRELSVLDDNIAQATINKSVASTEEPNNPAFIQLQSQIKSAEIELAALSAKKDALSQKMQDYEGRLARTPQVERQFRALTRDYENAWGKYKELKAKQMEAQLAQVMETERKGERFTLIEPPELPEKPLKPNRMAVLVLGVVFSFAGGVGTVAVSETTDATVRGVRGVSLLLNSPPLAAIPRIDTEADRQRRRRRRIGFAVAIVALIGMGVAAFHFFFMPLDVFWYAVQRRLGLQVI